MSDAAAVRGDDGDMSPHRRSGRDIVRADAEVVDSHPAGSEEEVERLVEDLAMPRAGDDHRPEAVVEISTIVEPESVDDGGQVTGGRRAERYAAMP